MNHSPQFLPGFGFVGHGGHGAGHDHLGAALEGDDPGGALKTARGWAELLFTTESLVGAMVGISILKMESIVGSSLRASNVTLDDWTPIPNYDLDVMSRVYMAAPAFTNLGTPQMKLGGDRLNVGRCISLAEGISTGWMLKNPLSNVRRYHIQHIDEQLEETEDTCRLTILRKLWKSPPTEALKDPTELCSAMPEHEICQLFVQVPLGQGAQEAIGLELSAIAVEPFLFNRYR